MPLFEFKGRGNNGQLIDGEIEGASSTTVAGLLMDRGVTPISIVEKQISVDILVAFMDRFDLHKVSIEELLMFTRQMSALIKSGIPITRAIAGILESIENPLVIKSLRDILEQLESGRSLSISFSRHRVCIDNESLPTGMVMPSSGQSSIPTACTVSYRRASSP